MEVQVLKGRDLVPKDSNGLSDPYVIIKYGPQVMFRSSVIKKTLNPHWAESATLTAPGSEDIVYVVSGVCLCVCVCSIPINVTFCCIIIVVCLFVCLFVGMLGQGHVL